MRNLHGFLHGNKWILLHGIPDIAVGSSKKGESNSKRRAVASHYISMVGSWITYYFRISNMYVGDPQYGPLSLYIKLGPPPIARALNRMPNLNGVYN